MEFRANFIVMRRYFDRVKLPIFSISMVFILVTCGSWGFLVHRTINQLAVYRLPRPMQDFFWKNRAYLVQQAPRPDIRRNSDAQEASRHFIDLEAYGDSAAWKMPLRWDEAVRQYTMDTLKKYGYVPYEVQRVRGLLTEAFRRRDRDSILFYSADLGHYIGDANVPLHTTVNYDGQLTGQRGLHSLWESAVPDVAMDGWSLRDGHRARYLDDPGAAIWSAIRRANGLVKGVLAEELAASKEVPDTAKYHKEMRNGREYRGYSKTFVKDYGDRLGATVNQQLVYSADLIADFWYTSWVDGGKPDLDSLLASAPDKSDRRARKAEFRASRKDKLIRDHLLMARQQMATGD